MTAADDEARLLAELDGRSWLRRAAGYLRFMGPGYLQSATTLGGGTAFASIFAGAAFGYELLWVAPVAMLFGIVVLAAVAHQTLSNPMNPYAAMHRFAGRGFAYGFALGAILSSIIWQFAQYALAGAMLAAIARSSGVDAPTWAMGLLALAWSVTVALLYDVQPHLVRLYERIIKGMVWFIVLCFAYVVVETGVERPLELWRGLLPGRVPGEVQGVKGVTLVVSGLAAAVGANMVFVYPYTLRRRGWGRAHRRLARFDLLLGMFVPYVLAASLMVIAAANVIHYQSPELFTGKKIAPWQVAEILAAPERLGPTAGMWVFGLGIVAMALSSITMQMLSSGFALCEMLGVESRGRTYRIGMMLPAVGVLGALFWQDIQLWLAVPTNVICGFLLPVSYLGFIRLQQSREYLGADRPAGARGLFWTAGMIAATLLLVVFLVAFCADNLPGWIASVRGAGG